MPLCYADDCNEADGSGGFVLTQRHNAVRDPYLHEAPGGEGEGAEGPGAKTQTHQLQPPQDQSRLLSVL